jgi:multiple sugar transport system substrate-binding protein
MRTSMLKAARLDPAKPPQTYQEILQIALKLNNPAKGIYGWGIPGSVAYFTIQSFCTYYLAWGAQYINANCRGWGEGAWSLLPSQPATSEGECTVRVQQVYFEKVGRCQRMR